jgi:hypothetical protein
VRSFEAVFGPETSLPEAPQEEPGDACSPRDLSTVFWAFYCELHDAPVPVTEDIGNVLLTAARRSLPGLAEVVRGAFEFTHFSSVVRNTSSGAWWRLAWQFLGRDFVVEQLSAGLELDSDGSAARARLHAIANVGLLDEVVLPLVRHPMLGRAASHVAAARMVTTDPARILAVLHGQPLATADGKPDIATVLLVKRLAQVSPGHAIAWLAERLSAEANAVRESWWAQIIPVLPVGPERARALGEWISSTKIPKTSRTLTLPPPQSTGSASHKK